MKLSIEPLSQRDSRWRDKKLGTSTVYTIGSDGCALTCLTMICNYYGKEIFPDSLNDNLVRNNGYTNGVLLNWGGISDIYHDITVDWGNYIDCSTVDAPLDKIDSILFSKKPVIVKVDYDKSTAKMEQHFILIKGKTEDGSYICNDPYFGDEIFFHARYGNPARYIFKIVVYNGTPKVTTTLEDKLRDLEDKVSSLNKTVAELSLENNQLRTDLSLQEKENNDLIKQASESRSLKDKAVWEKEQAEIKSKSLEEEVVKLQEEITRLKSERDIDKFTSFELLRALLRRVWGGGDHNGR